MSIVDAMMDDPDIDSVGKTKANMLMIGFLACELMACARAVMEADATEAIKVSELPGITWRHRPDTDAAFKIALAALVKAGDNDANAYPVTLM